MGNSSTPNRAAGGKRVRFCVCDITGDDFNVSGPTISHHLKMLREAGLIDGERRETWIYYRPVKENLRQLVTSWTHGPQPANADIRTQTVSGGR